MTRFRRTWIRHLVEADVTATVPSDRSHQAATTGCISFRISSGHVTEERDASARMLVGAGHVLIEFDPKAWSLRQLDGAVNEQRASRVMDDVRPEAEVEGVVFEVREVAHRGADMRCGQRSDGP